MPHPNVTIYDLLLSCPNDVVEKIWMIFSFMLMRKIRHPDNG